MRVVSDHPYQETMAMKNRFHPEKFYDHKIVDENGDVVGHVRVKPSTILWKAWRGRKWRGVTLQKFGELMKENGKEQKK